MSKVPTMNPDTLLTYLRASDQATFEREALAAHFAVSVTTISKYMQALIGRDLVKVTRTQQANVYVLIGAKPKTVGVVTAFRSDNWKPAMSGYERQLRAAADLAMAGRA